MRINVITLVWIKKSICNQGGVHPEVKIVNVYICQMWRVKLFTVFYFWFWYCYNLQDMRNLKIHMHPGAPLLVFELQAAEIAVFGIWKIAR